MTLPARNPSPARPAPAERLGAAGRGICLQSTPAAARHGPSAPRPPVTRRPGRGICPKATRGVLLRQGVLPRRPGICLQSAPAAGATPRCIPAAAAAR